MFHYKEMFEKTDVFILIWTLHDIYVYENVTRYPIAMYNFMCQIKKIKAQKQQ
jgi:hypothetical protein